jgi:hypothetical protein
MLIRRATLDRIAGGEVDLAFRRWRRPTVRPGGTLTTAIGVLAIDAVEPVEEAAITDEEARRAGAASADVLRRELARRADGDVYRVRFHHAGADPRVALREDAELGPAEMEAIATRLARLDRARGEPWTRQVLELIREHPARRAPELAAIVGRETLPFKADVRKLKALGLTESLPVGYRLSPRGEVFLSRS